uniref:G_PROTEIN_RECEP_F1_2 domain-containing protein n=1 Tax=Schistosoma mansoni TaxID=6183 RepID=A0A5K4FCC4_SCHMA
MCDISTGCYTTLYKYLNYSTQLINNTIRDELLHIYWEEINELKNQSKIPILLIIIIILIFLIMIIFGIISSSLIIYIILRKYSMRTRGNLFILNLAISDLTLCLITQPFNLIRLLNGNYNWILGQFLCKFSSMFQGTNIFVSTFSITAIAIDRFQCIIYPTTHRGNINTAIKLNYLTWIIAIILASPLVYFSHITQLNHLQCTEKADNLTIQKLKVIYSLAALIIQYMTPLFIFT